MRPYYMLFSIILFLASVGCSKPAVPIGVKYAEVQKLALWSADAKTFAPDRYQDYSDAYNDAKDRYIKENTRFPWLRDYAPIKEEFRLVLGEGNAILAMVKRIKSEKARDFEQRISSLRREIEFLKNSTSMINEGRLLRKSISKAEVLLTEADYLYRKYDYDAADVKLKGVNTYALESMEIAHSILSRYIDREVVQRWRALVKETIDESKRKGTVVIIVSKIDQKLMVYKKGRIIETYNIGLGRNGLKDKLYAGDGATPEGRYYIVKKNAGSRFYKALLFDYPNNEDRIRFNQARKKGLIPAGTGIGSLLEIHGGGADGMTKGCISLENKDMDRLYKIVAQGTPVTIVGAINDNHEILSTIRDI